MRTVTINAIIPVDKKLNQPNKKFKTLYLLHGIFGNYTDWVCGTRIQRWAQDHDLAVIMPSGENKFYVDNENSHEYYSQFIGEELVSITRAMFLYHNVEKIHLLQGCLWVDMELLSMDSILSDIWLYCRIVFSIIN